MSWATVVAEGLRELFGWSKKARETSDEEHERVAAIKRDIDRRHVERRDLSKDPRSR